ncbi:MAG: hypothetical protein C5B48_08500 [Candidatus Rokuibacteriota bacterium]|nr:MAG: hypothetical protein C5B48_08500 [Candidatus Rokubacteria bacterium]
MQRIGTADDRDLTHGGPVMDEIHSRKVRRILSLEARAAKLQARYDTTLARVAPAKERAEALRQAAADMELLLTGSQLGELRRARSERA